MDTQNTPITCPQCSQSTTLEVPLKVNTQRDRGARERILSGDLFAFFCRGCSFSAEVLPRGFLYQDPEQHLMVYLSPGGGDPLGGAGLPEYFADYRLRVVSDRVRLVEQILISDAGLDDRHVMILKSLMKPLVDQQQIVAPEWTVFSALAMGESRDVALNLPDGSVVVIPGKELNAVIEQYSFPPSPPLLWQWIDESWAAVWIREHPIKRRGLWWKR